MANHLAIKQIFKDGIEVVVRSAVASDALELCQYVQKIYQTSNYLITQPDEFDGDLSKQEKWIKDLQDASDGILLIALDGTKIVGNIDFKNNDRRKRIAHRGSFGMSIDEAYRGVGIGKFLLETLICWAKREGSSIEKIELGVLSENSSAIKLYESMGFQREGLVRKAVKVSDENYIDDIQMGLFLK